MNKTKKINTVSVGIPAHNEEKNIQKIISDILKQNQKSWKLKEIIVYCDFCSDKTAERIKDLNNPLLNIILGKVRKGKTYGTQKILNAFDSDFLVMFDADLKLEGGNVITNLISGFDDPKVMLTSGNKRPFLPKNLIEGGIYSTFEVFYESKLKIKNGNNIFGCQGGCIAFRKSFAKSLNLPNIISDDAYLYLKCIDSGFKFRYIDKAKVYYKMANNISDYLKQLFRSTPQSVNLLLQKQFGNRTIEEFSRPMGFLFFAVARTFLKRPIPTLTVILINILAKPFIPIMAKKYVSYYDTAASTK